jgi:SAM-dependent methyltransferase
MSAFDRLRGWLRHPSLRGVDDLHDPQRVTGLRLRVIRSNPFLVRLYEDWYARLAGAVPAGAGAVLELGSGAGFLAGSVPGLVTSEIFFCPNVKVILDGQRLPFADGTLRAIVMSDVLHHIPQPRWLFAEAARCVRTGGVVTLVEPWMTRWSLFIYRRLHYEPMDPASVEWEFPPDGPLAGANSSLPWILFQRDRAQFEQEFPQWSIEAVRLLMPFRYVVSGGVSLRPLMPGWSYPLWGGLERLLSPWMGSWAMFAHVTLRRVG